MNTEAIQDSQTAETKGTRLRNAREQLGLSQQAVAERLCLKVSTIRDIENDKAPGNLALTFLRGYIRSYARLVHLPEEELLPITATQTLIKAAPIQLLFTSDKCRNKKREVWLISITWLVLFVVTGLTGTWWWQNHKAQQDEISSMTNNQFITTVNTNDSGDDNGGNSNQNIPLDTDANHQNQIPATMPTNNNATLPTHQADMDAAIPNINALLDTGANRQNQIPASMPTNNNATLPTHQMDMDTPIANINALVMDFNADCWLEFSDATGKKLFSGLQRKDGRLNLTGQAPYKLKIGAPAAVQIQFQGKSIDLSRFIKTNQVARLTLNAESSQAQ